MSADIEARAEAFYTAGPPPRPRWSQLGEATKSVWRGYVLQGKAGPGPSIDPINPPPEETPCTHTSWQAEK